MRLLYQLRLLYVNKNKNKKEVYVYINGLLLLLVVDIYLLWQVICLS